MELRQLEYYVAVVQHGSILQAASALNLSQPPLGVAMKQLEQELGTPLFFRGARRIQLTAAGERFYQRALDILSLTEDTRREITGYAQGQGASCAWARFPPPPLPYYIQDCSVSRPSIRKCVIRSTKAIRLNN